MYAYHDSQKLEYRRPFGALMAGQSAALHLDAAAGPAGACFAVLWKEGESARRFPMERAGEGRFFTSVQAPPHGALLWYYFLIDDGHGGRFYYGNNPRRLGGPGTLYEEEPPPFQITVYENDGGHPWFQDAVVYQIFPDRFCRGKDFERRRKDASRLQGWKGPSRVFLDNWRDTPFYTKNEKGEVTRWPFFGGTLEGIREKLLYLKSLGVGAIYLNPIFEASSNHKYDTADYMKIDPGFGDEESFRRLVKTAEQYGIGIILDGVFSHTGADSMYFNKYGNYKNPGACQGEKSPYYSWYHFLSFPNSYESWWGVDDLPKADKSNPSFADFICGENGVVRRWMKAGIRGWRLDVADELPDGFIRYIRSAMTKENPGSVLIGEVWEDASNKISYGVRRTYLLGRALDSVTNYPFRLSALDYLLGKASAPDLAAILMSLKENYPPERFAMALNLIGSHDRVRALTVLGDAPEGLFDVQKAYYKLPPDKLSLARQRLKLLSLIQFAVPGVPCVYYGDEAGVQGYEDPYNRGPFPWGAEDGELTAHYRFLGLLRHQFPAFTQEDFMPIALTDHVFAVRRRTAEAEVLILVNRGVFEHETVSVDTGAGYVLDLLRAQALRPENGKLTLRFPPLTAKVLYCLPEAPRREKRQRSAGVLCHIGSIPSLGETPSLPDAFRFIDFLKDSGQKLWQLLPLNPAGKGDSPFYSPSVFALGGHFARETLPEPDAGFEAFCHENAYWLEDYALFMALEEENGGAPWQSWSEDEKNRTNVPALLRRFEGPVLRYKLEQYGRQRQWEAVRRYANDRGVALIGDIPVYPSPEGADVWARRGLFRLDEEGFAALHAGVPPDYFCEEGQDWGSPLYHWESAKEGVYTFWEHRLRRALTYCDWVRLDHFRSFSAYFAIPDGKRPQDGQWLIGAGIDFFTQMRQRLGRLPLIAEDLGVLDTGVFNLLKLSGLPGMNVWQFSAAEMEAMGEAEAENRIFYSGTHDNQTLTGWCACTLPGEVPEGKAREIVEKLYASKAPWVITPLQDILLLGDEARMNTPGTIGCNWKWKAGGAALTTTLRAWLKKLAEENGR